jgi:alpha-1,2-mannosyltransferase
MAARRYMILILIAGLLGVALVGYVQLIERRSISPWLFDFANFYLSAKSLDEGRDIYRPLSVEELGPPPVELEFPRETFRPNLNMPFVAELLWPLVHTDLTTALLIWTVLSVGFVLVSAWMLAGELTSTKGSAHFYRWMIAGILAIFLLAYYPSLANASLGQFGQVLLVVLTGAWLAARRGDDRLAGMLFGLALVLKPFTGIVLLILPWLRRWNLMRWYIATFAAITLFSAIAVGPGAFLRYAAALEKVDWYGMGWNASLLAPLSVLFGAAKIPGWFPQPWLAKVIWIAGSAMLYAALVLPVRKLEDPRQGLDLGVGGAMPLMLLVSPLGWLYYFPIIWITVAAVFLATKSLASRWCWRILAIAALVLTGLPYSFGDTMDTGESLDTLLTTSGDTAALLATFAVVVGSAWHLSRYKRSAKSIPDPRMAPLFRMRAECKKVRI